MKHNMLLSLLLCLIALICAEPVECTAQAQQHRVSVKGNSPLDLWSLARQELSILNSQLSIVNSQLSSDQRLVGYTVTDAIDVSGAAFEKAGTYSVGAVLTPQMLASYEGCRVVGIRMAAALNLGLSRTFIYDVSDLGIVAQVEQYQRLYEGWNEVFFNGDGYVIQGTETLFFGFDYTETDEMVSNDQGGLCGVGDELEGSFYAYGDYGKGEGLYSLSGLGRLCVQLIVDVSSLPMLDMDMTYLDAGFKYKQPGEAIEGLATFTNVGRATANGFQVGWKLDDQQPVLTTVTDSVLAVGASDSWQFICRLPEDIAVGMHTLKVFVSQVGGEPMPDRSHNDTLSASFAVYRESMPRQKAYFEVYTDASTYYSALLNDALKVMKNREDIADKLALVNVHRPGTALAVSEAAYLHSLYAYTWPTFTINRSYFPGEAYIAYDMNYYLDYQSLLGADFNAGIIGDMVFQDYYSPSFAGINLQADYDADTRQFTITANGDVLPESDAIYGDLALTLMVVEDGVKSQQAIVNSTTGRVTTNRNYMHQQVLRGYLTSPIGDALQVADGKYSVTVTETLNSKWNVDNVTIVGLLTKRADEINSANVRDYDVINATSVALSAASGILVPSQSSAETVARFTLDGKRISSSASHKGIMVERLSDGTVRKVLSRF